EYGSRAGFWRLYRLFKDFELPATVFGVATAMQRNPAAVDAMLNANWEIASHGYKWIDYQNIPLQEEQEHIAQAIEIHEKLTGAKPKGWYTGRVSENTRSLVLEHSDIIYDSDSYADDLPYWQPKELIPSERKPHLIVPYTLDANDMRFTTASGFSHAVPFYEYLRDTFDMLYTEGEHTPKMMSIGLHPRLIGRPGRLHGLKKFIEHIVNHDSVWVCRRQDIAEHWYREYPPKSE
ncbi:MAG: polysaccharide deacetylase family protein, partial [Acidiferrobacterales bacterium]|nr:polysaccharide deacetylase family protein [Acidiferrobacterales bacterium]